MAIASNVIPNKFQERSRENIELAKLAKCYIKGKTQGLRTKMVHGIILLTASSQKDLLRQAKVMELRADTDPSEAILE